jgi:hypothetical protein
MPRDRQLSVFLKNRPFLRYTSSFKASLRPTQASRPGEADPQLSNVKRQHLWHSLRPLGSEQLRRLPWLQAPGKV